MKQIKLVAVDMDGTFLGYEGDNFSYNKQRFNELYADMKKHGVRFTVASGNQYYQLRSFFPEIHEEISFVAENGGVVVSEHKDMFSADIPKEVINQVLDILQEFDNAIPLLCGRKSAYFPDTIDDAGLNYAGQYYHRIKKVSDLRNIDDRIVKIALTFKIEDFPLAFEKLHEKLAGLIVPVSSGHGDIDLMPIGVHKASGLQLLEEKFGIDASEIVAFGDSGNDYEMISRVGLGVAMKNAAPKIMDVANDVTDFNYDQGVLNYLEKLSKAGWQYE